MSEISFIKRASGLVDLAVQNGDVVLGDDLHTAIGLSLFTNSRSTEAVFNADTLNANQGWWGDTQRESPLGSLIWKYIRSKATSAVLELVRSSCIEALSWLIEDGVAGSVNVEASWNMDLDGMMDLKIIINKPTGGASAFNYQFAWDFLEGR